MTQLWRQFTNLFSIHFTFFLLLASIAIVSSSEPKKRDIFLGVKTNVIQNQIDDDFGGKNITGYQRDLLKMRAVAKPIVRGQERAIF